MSFDALAWAAKQKPGNLAAKMVLLALANYAGETGLAYPSTAAIAEFGDMNHKTATAALDRLEALGLVSDSGKRTGRSGQIKVYQLHIGSLPKTEASQKRKPPVFSDQATQKRVTDTVKEPVSSEAKASSVSRECADIAEAWNLMADSVGLSKVSKLTDKRSRACAARLRDYGLAEIQQAIQRIPQSPFLCGEAGGWRADFDFLLQPDSVTKILEGKYDGHLGRNNRTAPSRDGGGLEAVARDVLDTLRARNGDCQPARPIGPTDAGGSHGRVIALPAPDRSGGDDGHRPPRMALGGL